MGNRERGVGGRRRGSPFGLGRTADCAGHYFAIAPSLTIVAILLRLVATNWTDLTGGGMGLSLPVLSERR